MKVSRRTFLKGLGAAGVVLATRQYLLAPAQPDTTRQFTSWQQFLHAARAKSRGASVLEQGLGDGSGGFLVPVEYVAKVEEAIRGRGIIRGRPIRIPTTWELGDMVTLDDMEGR